MEIQITGPPLRPDMRYWAERARDERIDRALAEYRARHNSTPPCPACGSAFGLHVRTNYCDQCGEQPLLRNGYPVGDQRSAHPCPGCAAPTTRDRCDWCRKWEAIEARALARFGTVTERQVSALGSGGRW